MNSLNWKNIFISGVIFAVLAIMLAAGIYLVRRPQSQDISSKAAGCDMRWPADPSTACGKATQSPGQGVTNVSLTPNFHWDYGGYRPKDNGQCVQPSGCGTYSASVYLFEGSNGGAALARCDTTVQTGPVKDCSFSSFKYCIPNDPNCHTDGQQSLASLKPGTTYWWRVTPYFDGTVHAEQTWNYTFTTGSGFVCNSMTLTPNNPVITLTSLARQLTASASGGSGSLTYTFTVTNTGGAGNGTLNQTPTGSPVATWTAPNLGLVATNQSWVISAKAKDSQGKESSVGGCTVTLAYSPEVAGAACQMVQADKDLTKINLGDTVTFTGYGSLGTDQGDSIDQIEFTLYKDNAVVSTDVVGATRAPEKDSGNLKFWKAVKSYTLSQPGNYSVKIRVHWQGQNVWKA